MKIKILRSLAAIIAALYLLGGCSSEPPEYRTYLTSSGEEDGLPVEGLGEDSAISNFGEKYEASHIGGDIGTSSYDQSDFIAEHDNGTASSSTTSSSSSSTTSSEPKVTTGNGLVFPSNDKDSNTGTSSTTSSASAAQPTPAPDGSKPAQPATIDSITNETFLKYDTVADRFAPTYYSQSIYLYNFNTSLSMGFGIDGSVLPTEADYGIKGVVDGQNIYFTIYDNVGGKSYPELYMQGLDAGLDKSGKLDVSANKFKVGTSSYTNGLYRVAAIYPDKDPLFLYYYVNGDEVWLCEETVLTSNAAKNYQTSRNAFMNVINNSNTTPENSITMDKVWYPFPAVNEKYRCDTDRWVNLSNTFIDDSWSDAYKLYVIQAWLRDNIAYDRYAESYTNSRAVINNDYTGKYSVYDSRAGVCYDYANLVAIMCRSHGIPAITIGSTKLNHVWNAVYVDNHWVEIDICAAIQYEVYEDISTKVNGGYPLYGGFYDIFLWNGSRPFPSDATANQWFQQNSYVAR